MKPEITFKLGEIEATDGKAKHYLDAYWNDGEKERSHRYEAFMFGQEGTSLIGSMCPLFRCALDAFIQQAWEPVKWKEFCDRHEKVPYGDGFALILKKEKE